MKIVLAVVVALGILLGRPLSSVRAETIPSFDASIEIRKDGSFLVSEKIVYDFGSDERHGIFRYIPFMKRNSDGKRFIMNIANMRVVDESGRGYPYAVTKEGEQEKIKIGDANKTVSGIHTYEISYSVGGGVTYFSDHDELYWQVTGTDWPASIESATVRLTLPQKVDPASVHRFEEFGSLGRALAAPAPAASAAKPFLYTQKAAGTKKREKKNVKICLS